MRRLGRRLLLQAKNNGSENSKYIALFIPIVLTSSLLVIRSCSNIVIHTPTTRSFTKGHFIWKQEGNSDSLIQTPIKRMSEEKSSVQVSNGPSITATPTSDKNVIDLSEDTLVSTVVNDAYWKEYKGIAEVNVEQLANQHINQLHSNGIYKLNQWNQLSSEKKSKYPDFLVTVLDKACMCYFTWKPVF